MFDTYLNKVVVTLDPITVTGTGSQLVATSAIKLSKPLRTPTFLKSIELPRSHYAAKTQDTRE